MVVSVFDRFFRAAADGRFRLLDNRSDLWMVLTMLTERKVLDKFRRDTAKKRGGLPGNRAPTEQSTGPDDVSAIVDRTPSVELTVAFAEQVAEALACLPNDSVRQVAEYRLEGYSIGEIAGRMMLSTSSIERKLRVVRTLWQSLFE